MPVQNIQIADGTVSILASNLFSSYYVSGTATLMTGFGVTMTGTPRDGTRIKFEYGATATLNSISVSITFLGTIMPADYAAKKVNVDCYYDATLDDGNNPIGWIVDFTPAFQEHDIINEDHIIAGAIHNAHVAADAGIALSKLESLTSGKIIVGSAAGVPTAVRMSGDGTMSNTGVLTLAEGSSNPMTTLGDMIIMALNDANNPVPTALAIGTSGQFLSSNGTLPAWAANPLAAYPEIQYIDGVTSNIQIQIDALKSFSNPMTTLGDMVYALWDNANNPVPSRLPGGTNGQVLSMSAAMGTDGEVISISAVTPTWTTLANIPTSSLAAATEIGYLSGVTSNIQTQIDALEDFTNPMTRLGDMLFMQSNDEGHSAFAERLAIGTSGKFLSSNGDTPEWVTLANIPTSALVAVTEIGYLTGVTSAIQTQLSTKLESPMTTGTDGQVLTVRGGVPVWSTPTTGTRSYASYTTSTALSASTLKNLGVINSVSGVVVITIPSPTTTVDGTLIRFIHTLGGNTVTISGTIIDQIGQIVASVTLTQGSSVELISMTGYNQWMVVSWVVAPVSTPA